MEGSNMSMNIISTAITTTTSLRNITKNTINTRNTITDTIIATENSAGEYIINGGVYCSETRRH
jgi:hypothetical protein